MFEVMKMKINEYLDSLDEGDMEFTRKIYVIIRKHLEKTGKL